MIRCSLGCGILIAAWQRRSRTHITAHVAQTAALKKPTAAHAIDLAVRGGVRFCGDMLLPLAFELLQ